jgi:hypothetical protein
MNIRTILFIVPLLLCFSCGGEGHSAGTKAQDSDSIARVRDGYCRTADGRLILRSLKALRYLHTADTADLIDLSRQGIREMPDLSAYNARTLNISGNSLTGTFPTSRLPRGLRSLDLSHNSIDTLYFPNALRHLNVSRCDIRLLWTRTSWEKEKVNLKYLDLSYNQHIRSEFGFDIFTVDTLILTRSACDFRYRPIIGTSHCLLRIPSAMGEDSLSDSSASQANCSCGDTLTYDTHVSQ